MQMLKHLALGTTLSLGLLLSGTTAALADGGESVPPHSHILVLGVEEGPEGITYRKCVDLANNQELPLHAHHEHLHGGRAGDALRNAGNFPLPSFFIRDCAHLAELFGPPTK